MGMGTGRLCAVLDRRGWRVSGIDLSPEMVAAARRRLPQLAERLVEGPIEQLPFDDGSSTRSPRPVCSSTPRTIWLPPLPSWRACCDCRAWPC